MLNFPKTTTIRGIPHRLKDRLLMQRPVQRVLHHFGTELEDKEFLFVLGCYNSGTTLLANMLQSHPHLDGLPNEGAFLSDALPFPERLGWPRMWCMCADELGVSVDDTERARRIQRQWSLWLRNDPDIVVEKTISNVLRIDFLARNFPRARFVHIVRNGYAVASGIRRKANLRRWKNPLGLKQYPIELCARQWVESNRVVRAAEDRGHDIVSITYEDLTANPAGVLNSVFRAIGVDEVASAGDWDLLEVHELRSEIRNMNRRSIEDLSVEEMAAVTAVAGPELEMGGYLLESAAQ